MTLIGVLIVVKRICLNLIERVGNPNNYHMDYTFSSSSDPFLNADDIDYDDYLTDDELTDDTELVDDLMTELDSMITSMLTPLEDPFEAFIDDLTQLTIALTERDYREAERSGDDVRAQEIVNEIMQLATDLRVSGNEDTANSVVQGFIMATFLTDEEIANTVGA